MEEVKFDSDFSLNRMISTMTKTRFTRQDNELCVEHVELKRFVKSVGYLGQYLGGIWLLGVLKINL